MADFRSSLQEVVAALMLPGPFVASGVQGWTARELAAVCPSVSEPHHASQILWDMRNRGITQHYGSGRKARHYVTRDGRDILSSSIGENWYPSKEIRSLVSHNCQKLREGLIDEALPDHERIRSCIWDVWISRSWIPLSKKDILEGIRERYPNCPEHPVSQQLYVLTRSGKIRQDRCGDRVVFVPVLEEDLVSLMETPLHQKRSKVNRRDFHSEKNGESREAMAIVHSDHHEASCPEISGILPSVGVFLLENPEDLQSLPSGGKSVRAIVTTDASGQITQVYLEPWPLASDRQ